jgi:hypothetical protein
MQTGTLLSPTTVRPFDPARAQLEDYLDTNVFPARLEVSQALPLNEALETRLVTDDTRLMTFEYEDTLYAFPMRVVLAYNVIQGQMGNRQPWLMTFCNACNTGVVFDPVVDGQLLHFRRRGAFDGMLLIWDEETGTYWQHITGEGLHGASRGKMLRTIAQTRTMTAAEATKRKTALYTSDLSQLQSKHSHVAEKMRANPEGAAAAIAATIQAEDDRRPRFELGLGLWGGGKSQFYPLVLLHERDNVWFSSFGGRLLLVYQAPEALSPVAIYSDAAWARWEDDVLRFLNGRYLKDDVLYSADGVPEPPLERPSQLLMRWYGFALTFPGTTLPID